MQGEEQRRGPGDKQGQRRCRQQFHQDVRRERKELTENKRKRERSARIVLTAVPRVVAKRGERHASERQKERDLLIGIEEGILRTCVLLVGCV
jgi:hypothetical protein